MSLGIIGGTGALDLFELVETRDIDTSFGRPSTAPARIRLSGGEAWFLARHGRPHRIPPHRINYRANIETFRKLAVKRIIAINAVGGIADQPGPGGLAIPDQLIDYTWGRGHSFSDDESAPLMHTEFARPFTPGLRQQLLEAGAGAGVDVVDGGCVAVTQGPRLETAAEIERLARDGCTLVGMTSMPEAALAREAGIDYASICVVANRAASADEAPISMREIERVLASAMRQVATILDRIGTAVQDS